MDKRTKQDIQNVVTREVSRVWDVLCETYPKLCKHNPPVVKLSGRLYRTAGRAFQELNIVEFGYKFFVANGDYYHNMLAIIVPHEVIHIADYMLYGESEKKCGHGKTWVKMMETYGLEPNPFHNMLITRK